jgi:SpoVK/Ycf46/Vps4 family AAA+-type ATPase
MPQPAGPTLNAFQKAIQTHIRAGYPALYVVTAEEERAIDLIGGAVAALGGQRGTLVWSISRGLCTLDLKPVDPKTADPKRVLPWLLETKERAVFLMEDFHALLDERAKDAPLIIRQLRDLVRPFPQQGKTLVILSPVLKIPPELEKEITVLDLEMPTEAELAAVLENTIAEVKDNPRVELNLGGDARERIVRALIGLTYLEAENALAKAIVSKSRLDIEDIDMLLAEKEQIVRKSGVLEYYSSPEKFGSIGGLDELKAWLRQRARAFSEEARAFGIPNPRGLMLVGVPGCGKSLTAKAVAAEWKLPLVKFDLGRVFGGLVGQSEDNMRRALKMAEAVSPCVLWIDEIEKGLAGSRGQSGDGGVTARVFGTLLTWMEEKKKPVFVIATANDIDGLPDELLRKGRFDEIFFIDLPTPQERATVLAIHLTRARRDYKEFDLARHALAAEGFSGAELEQAVVDALYLAFGQGQNTALTDAHLERAIFSLVPLSRSMERKIDVLRQRAGQWRPAGKRETAAGGASAAMTEPPPAPPKRRRIWEVG